MTDTDAPEFTPEKLRAVMRGCLTVVKPGETLIMRPDWNATPNQVRELQEWLDRWHFDGDLPFRVIALPGEIAVTQPGTVPVKGDRVVIEWPGMPPGILPGGNLPGHLVAVRDAETGDMMLVERLTVTVDAQAAMITARATVLANEDGSPLHLGEDVVLDESGGNLRTVDMEFDVADMHVVQAAQ